jgi:hypothetical protein
VSRAHFSGGLAGGPIGKILEDDQIEIVIDRLNLVGSIALVGSGERNFTREEADSILQERPARSDLKPHPELPDDTKL